MGVSKRAVTGAAIVGLVGASAAFAPGAFAGKPPPPPPPPVTATVSFAPGTPTSISEAGGALSVTLQRNTTGSPGSKVNVDTFDGTATAPSDYAAQHFVAEIPASSSRMTFTIPIVNDTVAEKTETFVVKITPVATSDPEYAQVDKKKNSLTVTITDNDPCPALSVNDASAPEGDLMTFTVTMAGTCALPVQAHWATANTTTGGGIDATNPDDYNTQSGNVAIASGSTTATFKVGSNEDSIFEPNQTFKVVLSAPVNTSFADDTGIATIVDDDSAPTLSVNDVTDWEGNVLGFTVTRTGLTELPATFDWTTAANGSASASNIGDPNNVCGAVVVPTNDYVSTSATGVSIAAGGATGTATLNVTTCDDAVAEANETFSALLSNPGNASISDGTGVGTIRDNDPYNTVVVTDPSGTATQGTMVLETATVYNMNGDPLPGITVRGELWRDNFDYFSGEEVDGTLVATGSVVTDANGQITGGPYTDTEGFTVADYLYVCVPGYDGATASSCGVDLGAEGDGEEILATPTPPSTVGMATMIWTP